MSSQTHNGPRPGVAEAIAIHVAEHPPAEFVPPVVEPMVRTPIRLCPKCWGRLEEYRSVPCPEDRDGCEICGPALVCGHCGFWPGGAKHSAESLRPWAIWWDRE